MSIPKLYAIGTDEFDTELVGESYYLDAIKRILGVSEEDTIVEDFKVVLKFDNYNKFDENAVKALINGTMVGHLPKELARRHRDLVNRLGFKEVLMVCDGKAFRKRGKENWGIWLDYDLKKTSHHYTRSGKNIPTNKNGKNILVIVISLLVFFLVGTCGSASNEGVRDSFRIEAE